MELEFNLGGDKEGTVEEAQEAVDSPEEAVAAPEEAVAAPEEAVAAPEAETPEPEAAPPAKAAQEAETEAVVEVQEALDPQAMREEVAGGPLMLTAYLALWVVFFFFVFKAKGRTDAMSARLDELENRLDKNLEAANTGADAESP